MDRDLAKATGRQIRLTNDADCFALSEAVDGAGADFPIVFGIILGTGVGGGLIINKSLVRGPNAISENGATTPCPGRYRQAARVPAPRVIAAFVDA